MDSFRAHLRRLFVTAALVIISIIPASAADTGSISGSIFNQAGEPVADVVVRLSGDSLPAGRTTRTSVNGSYRFEYLVPGDYLIEVEVSAGSVSTPSGPSRSGTRHAGRLHHRGGGDRSRDGFRHDVRSGRPLE